MTQSTDIGLDSDCSLFYQIITTNIIVGKFESRTTYRENIDEKTSYHGLRRSSRFDYSLRIPDKIDWL